jgi:hypothetical protein
MESAMEKVWESGRRMSRSIGRGMGMEAWGVDDAFVPQHGSRSRGGGGGGGDDDEEALRWAAIERLPTYSRVRTAILSTENAAVVDAAAAAAALQGGGREEARRRRAPGVHRARLPRRRGGQPAVPPEAPQPHRQVRTYGRTHMQPPSTSTSSIYLDIFAVPCFRFLLPSYYSTMWTPRMHPQ